jgi:peptidoglycan hydrolase-like protein with peptidoglycan-binding domain
LQEALNAAEVAGLDVTGRYDAATFEAVRHYQQQVGVAATGLMNQQTWTALQSGRVV